MAANTTHSNNAIKTRVQLKSDTEENWRKSVLSTDHPNGQKNSGTSFVPLLGELIVFIADDAHPFSRLKIGDGNTNVLSLPFIDAGTINGSLLPESQVVTYTNRDAFPIIGSENKLYIDITNDIIYCYTDASGYTQLSNFNFIVTRDTVSQIVNWTAGQLASFAPSNGILEINTGSLPTLNYTNFSAVTNIRRGDN